MRPLRRQTANTNTANLDTRVTSLERRHVPDYPLWGSALLDDVTVNTAGIYYFGYTFPDECDPDDVDCLEDWHTDGEYLVLPLGYTGMFKAYVTAEGTSSLLGNYRTVVDAGDHDQHGKSWLGYETEIWRDNAPYGFNTYKGFQAWGENPPPLARSSGDDYHYWWYHDIHAGVVIMDPATDQWALRPFFHLEENLGGDATITGLAFAVELMPPRQGVSGFAG